MARTGAVLLLGNGLSIAVNEELSLDRLTQTFLDGHGDDRDLIDRLVGGVNLGAVDPIRDFEGIVAGLESAEEVITAFVDLARTIAQPDIQGAAAVLEAHGIPDLVRRLYYAYCAEVLNAIGDLARVDIPDEVMAFGEWVKAQHATHDRLSIFTLNYDVLMERMLIGQDLLALRWETTDFFSGLPERRLDIELIPGYPSVQGALYYPQDPPSGRSLHLHHLHGCLTHLRAPDGNIYKVSSDMIRAFGLYSRLAAGEPSDFVPSVILGSRKAERARSWPFSHAFLSLETDIAEARTVCIAGYSFRDTAVNDRLCPALANVERLIIYDYAPDDTTWAAFVARAGDALAPSSRTAGIEWYRGGFGAGPPPV